MQRLVRVLMVLLTLSALLVASPQEFSAGYQAGYKAGACYQCYGCIPPIPPIPPIPYVGEVTWQDGFNRGFYDGLGVNQCR